MIILAPGVTLTGLSPEQVLLLTIAGFTFRRHGEEAIVTSIGPTGIDFAEPVGRALFDDEKAARLEPLRSAVAADLGAAVGTAFEVSRGQRGVSLSRKP